MFVMAFFEKSNVHSFRRDFSRVDASFSASYRAVPANEKTEEPQLYKNPVIGNVTILFITG
jgi:hypothetical protein